MTTTCTRIFNKFCYDKILILIIWICHNWDNMWFKWSESRYNQLWKNIYLSLSQLWHFEIFLIMSQKTHPYLVIFWRHNLLFHEEYVLVLLKNNSNVIKKYIFRQYFPCNLCITTQCSIVVLKFLAECIFSTFTFIVEPEK